MRQNSEVRLQRFSMSTLTHLLTTSGQIWNARNKQLQNQSKTTMTPLFGIQRFSHTSVCSVCCVMLNLFCREMCLASRELPVKHLNCHYLKNIGRHSQLLCSCHCLNSGIFKKLFGVVITHSEFKVHFTDYRWSVSSVVMLGWWNWRPAKCNTCYFVLYRIWSGGYYSTSGWPGLSEHSMLLAFITVAGILTPASLSVKQSSTLCEITGYLWWPPQPTCCFPLQGLKIFNMPSFSDEPGKMYVMDMLHPRPTPVQLQIKGELDLSSFNPHGISAYVDEAGKVQVSTSQLKHKENWNEIDKEDWNCVNIFLSFLLNS